MDVVGFMQVLKKNKLDLFTLQDVEALYPEAKAKTLKNNLSNWLAKGVITRLKRNLYMLARLEGVEIPEYYIANRLYEPSYVSLETALSFYNILPEETSHITSITSKPTRTFRNKCGVFTYRTCRKNAYIGYRIMNIQGRKTLMADKEKAFTDFIHYRMHDGQTDFSGERFNTQGRLKLNRYKTRKYASLYGKRTLEKLREVL